MAKAAPRLSVIGLGNMGLPMAQQLVQAGFAVTGYDVDPATREQAIGAGVRTARHVAEAAIGATGVILMLPNSDIVESVLHQPELHVSLAPGATVIDMSSSEPLRTRVLAEELAATNLAMVDAPVSGGVEGARSGQLTIMAGGSRPDVERVTPWLTPLGRVIPTGPIGSGHAMKALNNLLSAIHLLATSEAMLTGELLGLDPQVMLSVFNRSSGKSGSTENKFPNFIQTGTFDSGFALRLMVKDMKIAVGIAEASGAPHSLADRAVSVWGDAAAELQADADHTEIVRWLQGHETAQANDQ